MKAFIFLTGLFLSCLASGLAALGDLNAATVMAILGSFFVAYGGGLFDRQEVPPRCVVPS